MEFSKSLIEHLETIKNRDLKAFMKTVKADEITLIMPNGKMIKDGEAFSNFHRDWFSDKDWSLYYEILKVNETKELSYAIIDVDYRDLDEKGEVTCLKYYLSLIFKKVEDRWLLVFDQNTIHK